ncbi:GNAT family N-acetyltransferase [Sphingomonas panacisoli]|uniref:GNAT family N-acetyltransferase n=1 Tax=Sphingomonas panacisoli TaxID=1813879 RepID=A0A5B8LI99_9SPHN|nr:GNAT family N-acetyltransferase [Sphingomonas panacisoli]QDZ07781.1 GNAT family N-acetyltransferase [Sphingomonas panacisoli]
MRIERDDLSRPEVEMLVEYHLREMHAHSPACHVFALDSSGLRHADVTVWTVWDDAALLGMGAMKHLDDQHGELKSMRTAPSALRRGVARAVLDHMIGEGKARGYRRLSLETGCTAPFEAAHALYRAAGFVETGPFAGYSDTGFSRYFALDL